MKTLYTIMGNVTFAAAKALEAMAEELVSRKVPELCGQYAKEAMAAYAASPIPEASAALVKASEKFGGVIDLAKKMYVDETAKAAETPEFQEAILRMAKAAEPEAPEAAPADATLN
jgi:hypothetical protein